jgi:outer membrane protein insertion porin family
MSRLLSSIWLAVLMAALASCSTFSSEFQGEDEEGKKSRTILVQYEGNDSSSAFILNRQIRYLIQDGFSKEPDKESFLQDAAADLEDYYYSNGFPAAKVGFVVERPEEETQSIVVRFRIQEGPRVQVTDVKISGIEQFKKDELLELWRRSHAGFLGTGNPWFVESEIRAFYRDIRAFYVSKGYLDAKVSKSEIHREEGSKQAQLDIEVYEGQLYTIASIEIPPAIEKILQGKKPSIPLEEPSSMQFLMHWTLELRNMLRELGYHAPEIARPILTRREGTRVFFKLPLKAGNKVRIGEILLEGNEDTRDQMILGKYQAKVGEWYKGSVEDEATQRLYRSGVFERVEFVHEELDDETIRITIKIKEHRNRALDFMLGWGSWEKLRGGVQFRERNLFGTGLGFDALGLVSTKGYRGSTTLLDKDFAGTGVDLALSARYFRNDRPSYTEEAFETDLSGTKYLFTNYKSRLGYLFKHQFELISKQGVTLPGEVLTPNKGTVFLELLRDERDNILFPTEGWRAFARGDFSSTELGGSQDFNRLIVNGSYYFPFSRKSRLIVAGEIGTLWPGGGAPTVAISERFFNGGANTVRSFEQDELGPKGPNGNPTGGLYRTVWKAELQVALLEPFNLALFADVGNVGVDINDFGLSNMRYGFGPGLILNFPGVPIRFDAGYNPDRRANEDAWVFHLTIGQTF